MDACAIDTTLVPVSASNPSGNAVRNAGAVPPHGTPQTGDGFRRTGFPQVRTAAQIVKDGDRDRAPDRAGGAQAGSGIAKDQAEGRRPRRRAPSPARPRPSIQTPAGTGTAEVVMVSKLVRFP
ncbi:hypothetical protein AL037_14650 [Salipiger aestuarii]|nr:hypothetical protein C357_18956 [Citreicella sp. 357]KAA8609605.1 hypothetical protein AL037_14650 [Salipiger aestuarii]